MQILPFFRLQKFTFISFKIYFISNFKITIFKLQFTSFQTLNSIFSKLQILLPSNSRFYFLQTYIFRISNLRFQNSKLSFFKLQHLSYTYLPLTLPNNSKKQTKNPLPYSSPFCPKIQLKAQNNNTKISSQRNAPESLSLGSHKNEANRVSTWVLFDQLLAFLLFELFERETKFAEKEGNKRVLKEKRERSSLVSTTQNIQTKRLYKRQGIWSENMELILCFVLEDYEGFFFVSLGNWRIWKRFLSGLENWGYQ